MRLKRNIHTPAWFGKLNLHIQGLMVIETFTSELFLSLKSLYLSDVELQASITSLFTRRLPTRRDVAHGLFLA